VPFPPPAPPPPVASYSISTNLHGAKLWTLFPPECAPALLELLKEAERSPLGEGSVDVRSWSPERRAAFEAAGMVQVRQERGETIFMYAELPNPVQYQVPCHYQR